MKDETRKFRWYGQPGERLPDAGDVLGFVDPKGRKPDYWLLVHHAWPVRGGEPEDLWLRVERLDFGPDASVPQVVWDSFGTDAYIPAVRMKRPPRRVLSKDSP